MFTREVKWMERRTELFLGGIEFDNQKLLNPENQNAVISWWNRIWLLVPEHRVKTCWILISASRVCFGLFEVVETSAD
jgi:hypothetical protein